MGDGIAGFGVGVWFLSTFKPGDAMNEKLKEFAAQAGFNLSWDYHCDEYELEQFAELVRQDERDNLYAKEMEQPTPNQFGTFSITVKTFSENAYPLELDIELLWAVNSADIAALEDAKATFEILKYKAPLKYQSMIYQSLALISKALGMSHSDAFQRIIDKARGDK